MSTTKTDSCAHCGGDVSTRGRKPKSGRRFCSNSGCQAAKQRLRRQAVAEARPAPGECSGCHKLLTPRNWRAGDEHGRWCTKQSCRTKRRYLQDEIASQVDLAQQNRNLEQAVIFLMEVVMADAEEYLHSNRVTCKLCGLTSAIPEWLHPTEEGKKCEGTLNGVRERSFGTPMAMGGAWPFKRRYLSAEELESAYGEGS
jgi:hypothetical protein